MNSKPKLIQSERKQSYKHNTQQPSLIQETFFSSCWNKERDEMLIQSSPNSLFPKICCKGFLFHSKSIAIAIIWHAEQHL